MLATLNNRWNLSNGKPNAIRPAAPVAGLKAAVKIQLTSEYSDEPIGAPKLYETESDISLQRNNHPMKTKSVLLALGSLLVLSPPALLAQNTNTNTNTNSLPLNQTVKYQLAFESDRALGERAVLPPGLKEKMRLTDEQRIELKPIEDDFANTSKQYQIANQPRIDAAQAAIRSARASKNTAQIEAARKQLQQVWAGLLPDREAAVKKIKPLLTPDQLTILEDPKNQWRENHRAESNDPSSKN